jgi:hypothetical protein
MPETTDPTPTPEIPSVSAVDLAQACNIALLARRDVGPDHSGVAHFRQQISEKWPDQATRSALFHRSLAVLEWTNRQRQPDEQQARRMREAAVIAGATYPLTGLRFEGKFYAAVAAAQKAIAATAASFN